MRCFGRTERLIATRQLVYKVTRSAVRIANLAGRTNPPEACRPTIKSGCGGRLHKTSITSSHALTNRELPWPKLSPTANNTDVLIPCRDCSGPRCNSRLTTSVDAAINSHHCDGANSREKKSRPPVYIPRKPTPSARYFWHHAAKSLRATKGTVNF